ncbi:MAG: DNA replication and repair protein RecF [Chloroflexota bacterium]|nr:DNA replication and repair protein RecF [Chloroflexota bacterium]MED5237511.1 DNA replication and repair protein RecF [Chloroflexota bacterium]
MRLKTLSLSNYRNHKNSSIDLEEGFNVFYGLNGQGKSNLFEGIYLLSIAKSSRVSNDKHLINNALADNGGHTQVLGIAEEKGRNVKAQIDYDISKSFELIKTFRINGVIVSNQEFVGNINSVFFDTDDISIISGPPLVRRKYLNILLSQINNDHVKNLQRYQKVLYQRNSLLKNIKDGKSNKLEIEFWDERLAEEASNIFFERNKIIKTITQSSKEFAKNFNSNINLDIKYLPKIGRNLENKFLDENPSTDEIKLIFYESLKKNHNRDIDQRITTIGPHRDDFEIVFNNSPASITASRGQSRIISLSLKLSEAKEIRSITERKPILILDDIFSELDEKMRQKVVSEILDFDQILLSTADIELIDKNKISDGKYFSISSGKVSED